MDEPLKPTADPDWIIKEGGYDPLRESSRAARFAISNGLLGVRGARAIHRGGRWFARSHTLVAGLFDTPDDGSGIPGLVATPEWLHVRILLQGKPLVHLPGDEHSQQRILDMRRGAVLTEGHLSNASAVGLQLRTLHLVSLSQRPIGLQFVQLEIGQGGVEVTLEASFEDLDTGLLSERVEQGLGVWRAMSSNRRLAIAAALSLQLDGRDAAPTVSGPFQWSWRWKSCPGQIVCLERLVAVMRSDADDMDPGRDAQRARRRPKARLVGRAGRA